MATANSTILKDVKVTINGTTFSNQAKHVELTLSAAQQDVTTMGNGAMILAPGGITSGTCKIDWVQDFTATTGLEAVLWPLFNTLATVVVSPTSGTASSTNPNYTFLVHVNATSPVMGAVGDVATNSVTWPISGTVVKTP